MKYRIAIASKDGKVISEHFGHCRRFSIVEVEEEEYRFIEFREVEPPCSGGEHTLNALKTAAERLSDCSLVVVSQIGMGAYQVLRDHQIKVYEYKGYVSDALSDIIDVKRR